MNRELWFRILQVAVVAPYVYQLSKNSENDYFSIGLKMVAASLVVANIKPILLQAAPAIQKLANATATASNASLLSDREKDDAVDVEFVKAGTK